MGQASASLSSLCCPATLRAPQGPETLELGGWDEPLPVLLGGLHMDQDFVQHPILPLRLEVVLEEREAEETAERENYAEAVKEAAQAVLKEQRLSKEQGTGSKREPLRLPIAGRRRQRR
eukprot:TRINITY_DN115535_c0_g1_i1.p1 TRINITY_DN115535_c0_g1~~TRINITY_DN115535_c0_g1_i1.p1  ORF type:complete len:119 (+),score=30.54 TRINITY_DN115535_c0_g1_i1:62-418(+)